MRAATWALEERERIVADAKHRLPRRHDDYGAELVDVVHRAFVAHLTGGGVHVDTVARLREQHGAGALIAGAQAVADALRARARDDADRAAVSDALDALFALFDPDGGAPLDIDVIEARPTLVHALSELARSAPSQVEPAPNLAGALLRIRAETASAALALDRARASTLAASPGLRAQPSAPDEVLVAAIGGVGDGVAAVAGAADAVGRLVRAASTIATAAGREARHMSFAIACSRGADDLEAVVRAGALCGAKGLLVLDEEAWARAGAGLACVPGAARTVEPAAAFGHDRWELSSLLARPPLLGRDDEIERLTRLLVEPSARPVLAWLFGASGIGKTSLVRAALAAAGFDDDNAAVLWGAADGGPWSAVAAMWRALAGAPAGHPRAAPRLARLVDGLAAALPAPQAAELLALRPVVAWLLGAVDATADAPGEPTSPRTTANGHDGVARGGDGTRLPQPAAAVAGPLDDDRSPRATRAALFRSLALAADALLARGGDDGRPAVIVVPSAELLDAPAREALGFLARHLGGRARLLFLSSTRAKIPPAFEAAFRVARIEVAALPAVVVRELCASVLGDDDQGLGAFVERARGSPLALLHALRFAVEGGLLRRREDRWDTSELEPKDIPARLDRLLRGRIERLPDDARKVLAACAALGPSLVLPAAVELVGVRLGLGREEVMRALAFLVDTGFLVTSGARPAAPLFADGGGGEEQQRPLAFEHPLLRTAAAAAATPAAEEEREKLHAHVAEALEAVAGGAGGGVAAQPFAAAIAHHHRRAGDAEAALPWLALAAKRSAQLDDRQGALALAREGIELAGDRAALAFPFLLDMCALLDDAARGQKEALHALVRAAEQTGDPHMIAQALLRVARFDFAAGDLGLADDAATRAVVLLGGGGGELAPSRLRAGALRLLGRIRFRRRDDAQAAAAVAAARAATAEDDRRGRALVDELDALMLLDRGDAVAAVERLLCARAHRVACADAAGEASSLDGIAAAYARTGRAATALALLENALRLRDRIGDDAGRAQSKQSIAEVLLDVGDATVALGTAEEARALAREHGLERLELAAALTAVRAHLALGEPAPAESVLDSVRRRARDALASTEVSLLGARARLLKARASATGASRERALSAALSRAQEAAAVAEEHGFLAAQIAAMALAGEVLLFAGDKNAALAWAQRAAELLDEGGRGPGAAGAAGFLLFGARLRPAPAFAPAAVLDVYARVLDALGDAEEAGDVRRRAGRQQQAGGSDE